MDEQRRLWDWHWQHWRERRAINALMLRRGQRVLTIVASLALERPKILDLGCGNGWFSQELSRFGLVTGVDLSAEAIAMAEASYPHIPFLAGNVLTDTILSGHFDLVVSQEVLAHVDDQARYLEVAAEVLRPGGYLILTTANKFVMDRLGASSWDPWPREHIARFLDMRDVKRLLIPNFRVLRTSTFLPMGSAGVLRLINSYKLNKVLSLLIPERYLETLKERAGLGYSLLVLAQKAR
ncbi:MAG: hypothetical protein AUH78_05170 [Gemmatimonadetes bacterium 13_1_40CM_4_69_8]|nr:MAG: hypothetical protein AUH78_05170 [Gemmatimonadetes bacterium 13_1_40CM_4_69_8]